MATRVEAHKDLNICTRLSSSTSLERRWLRLHGVHSFAVKLFFRMVHNRNGDNMSNIIAELVELKLTAKWQTGMAEYSPPPPLYSRSCYNPDLDNHVSNPYVYALYCVCSALCMLCTVYALHCVCSALCMLCTVYALHCVCSALCMLCTVYALYCV